MSVICTAAGQRITYVGTGVDSHLLLLTELAGSRRGFLANLPRAIAERFRIVAMDHRDVGQSDPENCYYTASDMAADVVALLHALGIEQVHVMGYSMGGTVTPQLALNSPGRMSHLILVSVATLNPDDLTRTGEPLPPPAPWWIDDPVERWRTIMPCAAAPNFRDRLTEEKLAALAEHERGNQASWPNVMRQVAGTTGQDCRVRLGEITAPALASNGQLIPVLTSERWDELAEDLSHAGQVVLTGVGHLVLEEAPDEVARAVVDFLPAADHQSRARRRPALSLRKDDPTAVDAIGTWTIYIVSTTSMTCRTWCTIGRSCDSGPQRHLTYAVIGAMMGTISAHHDQPHSLPIKAFLGSRSQAFTVALGVGGTSLLQEERDDGPSIRAGHIPVHLRAVHRHPTVPTDAHLFA